MAKKKDANYAVIVDLRADIARIKNTAVKRIARLEKLGYNTPAYRELIKSFDGGKPDFSVRGKSYNELVSLYWKMKRFVDDQTSTVRGADAVLKEMAQNTGVDYKSLKDLRESSKQFFRLAQKVKENNQAMENTAAALDYWRVWEVVNQYVKDNNIDLSEVADVDKTLDKYVQAIGKIPAVQHKDGNVIRNIK